MSFSQRQGLLRLIPKKAVLDVLTNWRPISLLNVDYKILSYFFNTRLKSVLPALININQRGFVPSRNIAENIMDAITLIDFIEEHQIPMILLQLDFVKAFDSMEWISIYQSLEFFGFPPFILLLFATLHNGFSSRIIGQTGLSPSIPICQGVLQGAPASPSLFAITAELLSVALHNDTHIVRIVLSSCIKLLSQFADDGDLFMMVDDKGLAAVLEILHKYGDQTGLQLNEKKTRVTWLGSLCTKLDFFLPSGKRLYWNDTPFIEILGIFLHVAGHFVTF